MSSKAFYVGFVLSSEDPVSKKAGENPKNCTVFQELCSSSAQLDIPIFSQKRIQQALGNEKFKGLKENPASEIESTRLLSLSVRPAAAWLSDSPIPAPELQMAPNEFEVRAKSKLGVPVYEI